MKIEEQLPVLLDELAEQHVTGEPPVGRWESGLIAIDRPRRRPRVGALVAAACVAVLLGGIAFMVAQRSNDEVTLRSNSSDAVVETIPPPATVAPQSAPDPTAQVGVVLERIDAKASEAGTEQVVLVFDRLLPVDRSASDNLPVARLLADDEVPPADRLSYRTQLTSAPESRVCGDVHSFDGNPIVDVFVPSGWFAIAPEPGVQSPADVSKIVVCEPIDGVVQISVWGAASDRPEDVAVGVGDRSIHVTISPSVAQVEPVPSSTSPEPVESVVVHPLVATTADGDAVVFDPSDENPSLLDVATSTGSDLGDGSNLANRVTYSPAGDHFVVGLCCAPPVGQVVSVPNDEALDGYGYAPTFDPTGEWLATIVESSINVIDTAGDIATVELPSNAGSPWDLYWGEIGLFVLGRYDSVWTLTAMSYGANGITIESTHEFALVSNFDDLLFAGTAVEGELAVHHVGSATVLTGVVDNFGNLNDTGRGSSLTVIDLPAPVRSAWFYDPGQLITVDADGLLRVGDRVIDGSYRWARR